MGLGHGTCRGYWRHSLPSPCGQFCWHDHEVLIRITTLQSSGISGRGKGGTTRTTTTTSNPTRVRHGRPRSFSSVCLPSLSLSPSPTLLSMSVQIFLPIVFRSLLITSCAVAAHSGSPGNNHKILFGLLICHLIILYYIR